MLIIIAIIFSLGICKGIESLQQTKYFVISISLKPDGVHLRYFKFRLFYLAECIV